MSAGQGERRFKFRQTSWPMVLFYAVVYCWEFQTSPSQNHGREYSSMFMEDVEPEPSSLITIFSR